MRFFIVGFSISLISLLAFDRITLAKEGKINDTK